MITVGNRVCDVGCDHGFLPIFLVQKGISPHVIAMDLREGPLSRAKEHIAGQGLNGYIETRLSDGVESLQKGEAETLVCAGMGGRLIMKILTEGREKCICLRELILQPQSEIPAFRQFLRRQGYSVVKENMIEEDGKFYFLLKAVWTNSDIPCEDPLYDNFGRELLLRKDPVLYRYLNRQKEMLKTIEHGIETRAGDGGRERLRELSRELMLIDRALQLY